MMGKKGNILDIYNIFIVFLISIIVFLFIIFLYLLFLLFFLLLFYYFYLENNTFLFYFFRFCDIRKFENPIEEIIFYGLSLSFCHC